MSKDRGIHGQRGEMKTHNYILGPVDTDSISFCKQDFSEFSEEEQKSLIEDLNSHMDELISWEHDGYFSSVVVVKSKNYILNDGKKVKFKGSSFKDAKKEKALKEMMIEIGKSLLSGIKYEEIIMIYHKYVKEAVNVKDIKRWSVKKTVTKAVMESATNPEARANEYKVYDAIKHLSPQEGDKIFVYDSIDGMKQEYKKGQPVFLKDGSPKMVENCILKTIDQYNNDTIPKKLVKRVYDTLSIFDTLLDMDHFTNYSLSRNFDKIKEI